MPATQSRIQTRNREAILEAALNVFSAEGFRGATLDRIAAAAGLSKPNVLYYFPSKEAIYSSLLDGLLHTWLNPLEELDPDGDPIEEILGYVRRKLDMARDFPRESRLFANEILQGAPRIQSLLTGELKELVDRRAADIRTWSDQNRIARVDPYHLIFSIWSLTQHYSDFDAQVHAVLGPADPFPAAHVYLEHLFRATLRP